ncbi:hypothetical protein EB796_008431 [Bugula neritina]|uniref:Uncharacterized protein n=1 Tax=Bugula neritina TaxID=10212 RepID=A0A7J7K3R0_BUGNE|nr:hypothetical protein EB796_008431 [Bugula neritina]
MLVLILPSRGLNRPTRPFPKQSGSCPLRQPPALAQLSENTTPCAHFSDVVNILFWKDSGSYTGYPQSHFGTQAHEDMRKVLAITSPHSSHRPRCLKNAKQNVDWMLVTICMLKTMSLLKHQHRVKNHTQLGNFDKTLHA